MDPDPPLAKYLAGVLFHIYSTTFNLKLSYTTFNLKPSYMTFNQLILTIVE